MFSKEGDERLWTLIGKVKGSVVDGDGVGGAGDQMRQPIRPLDTEEDVMGGPYDQGGHVKLSQVVYQLYTSWV